MSFIPDEEVEEEEVLKQDKWEIFIDIELKDIIIILIYHNKL